MPAGDYQLLNQIAALQRMSPLADPADTWSVSETYAAPGAVYNPQTGFFDPPTDEPGFAQAQPLFAMDVCETCSVFYANKENRPQCNWCFYGYRLKPITTSPAPSPTPEKKKFIYIDPDTMDIERY